MHLSFESLDVIHAPICKHLWWTSITTHLLGLSWRMIPFPQHPKPVFTFVRPREWGYGRWLNHLSIHSTSHILLSLQRCVFILVWFSPRHLIFSCVNVEMG
jgi:hypothetical protein